MIVSSRRRVVGLGFVGLVMALALCAPPAFAKGKKVVGGVYTETNNPAHNMVVAFARYGDGTLKQIQSVTTRGRGGREQQPGCTAHCPILDTQGEVGLAANGHLLFAVNAGSNTVTEFRVAHHKLKRLHTFGSGGRFPNSLTVHGRILYVLNSNSDSIAGFRFNKNGKITPIAGSRQALSTGAMSAFPRQIAFDNTGRLLAVTLLVPQTIDTFVVDSQGRAGPANANMTTTPFPFGFAFDHNDNLVASQVTTMTGTGVATSYRVSGTTLVPIDTESTHAVAPCWVVVTRDNRYVFVVNTGGGAPAVVTSFALSAGKMTFLGNTPAIGEFTKTDEALSRDSRYLYVIASLKTSSTEAERIDEYRVGGNGALTLIGRTKANLGPGASGLSAR